MSAGSNAWWGGPLLTLATLLALFAALEIGLRLWLDDERERQLPRVGLSEDDQMRLAWRDWQTRRETFGTTSYPSSFDALDPNLGWRVKPAVSARHVKPGAYEVGVTTNAFGLRGEHPTALDKPPATVRVGVFGDSQTFGETVDDAQTYVAALNRLLPANEFLNFGVRGYGTDQMLLYYEEQGARFDLDVVVLGFAFFHLERNAREFLFFAKPYFTFDDGELRLRGVPVPDRDALLADEPLHRVWPLLDRSVLARWVWQRLRHLRRRAIYAPDGPTWALTEALIARFGAAAKANGSEVVILSIDADRPELEAPLAALAERLGVGLVLAGPALRAGRDAGVDYTLPDDNHWNAAGNALVAELLAEYLCGRGLVRCPDRGRRRHNRE